MIVLGPCPRCYQLPPARPVSRSIQRATDHLDHAADPAAADTPADPPPPASGTPADLPVPASLSREALHRAIIGKAADLVSGLGRLASFPPVGIPLGRQAGPEQIRVALQVG
jgi:hypothetical protein